MSSNAQKARRSADTLEIVYDPRWSVEARREIAASLAAPGFAQDTLLQAMETRDYVAEFRTQFDPLGLDYRHLGAVTAAHWIGMWTIVHDAPMPDTELAEGALAQLSTSWKGTPAMRDARTRQVLAEWMIIESVIALEEQSKYRTANDREGLEMMANKVAENMKKKRSVNLRVMSLTDKGFVRTS